MAKIDTLLANPFHILGVSTRDNRQKIVEMAEERSLHMDHELCQRARADLISPRVRLSAEIAWLPGVAPSVAQKLVKALSEGRASTERSLPRLARANLLATALELYERVGESQAVADLIQEFALVVEAIDPNDVLRDINEDRAISGFPELSAVKQLEAELVERRKVYRAAVRDLLNRMDTGKMIVAMTRVVSMATNDGSQHGPALIDELVDVYESEAQGFLDKEQENIAALIAAVIEAAPGGAATVAARLDGLEKVAKNWIGIAKPIQISAKSRGIYHQTSRNLANNLRSLGIELYNEHNMLDAANRMTELLRKLFSDVPEFVERLDEDKETIAGILRKADERERENAEWQRSITFRAEVGLVFKEELSISPRGISWKNRVYPLESITHVRWGATRHSINGIPTGTNYTIAFLDSKHETIIDLKREATYSQFQNAFWRAVCVRLLIALVHHLKAGNSVVFGDMTVDDNGVMLGRRRLFGSNEKVHVGWGQVTVWSADGQFCIAKTDDKKLSGSVTYKDHWDTHLLEHVVRNGFKKGVRKLSDYLEN